MSESQRQMKNGYIKYENNAINNTIAALPMATNENEVEHEVENANDVPNLGDFRDLLHVMRYLEENILSNMNNVNNDISNVSNNCKSE